MRFLKRVVGLSPRLEDQSRRVIECVSKKLPDLRADLGHRSNHQLFKLALEQCTRT